MILNDFRTKEAVLKILTSTVLLSLYINALFFNGIPIFNAF